jgi:FixJ family two-component response regulator
MAFGAAGSEGVAVLVVDDDVDLVEIMRFLLEDAGVTCHSARSLGEVKALGARVAECGLALVDVDLGAGQPTGIDVSKWLEAHGFAGHIVFLTGHADDHPTLRRAIGSGGTVLSKPVETDVLLALLPRRGRTEARR